jgi:hypothetical protein
LTHNIVGLALARLCSFDRRRLVDVPLVIHIEFAKGVSQPEYVALLELRKFPGEVSIPTDPQPKATDDIAWCLVLAYLCSLRTFMIARGSRERSWWSQAKRPQMK